MALAASASAPSSALDCPARGAVGCAAAARIDPDKRTHFEHDRLDDRLAQ
jgi:hypothetical protein